MIGVSDLVAADPATFRQGARQWRTVAERVVTHRAAWTGRVTDGVRDGSWTGVAHTAAAGQVAAVDQRLAGHAPVLRQVVTTLDASATTFAAARSEVVALQRRARRLGLVVTDRGVALNPAGLVGATDWDVATLTTAADALGGRLTAVLATVNGADLAAAAALDALLPPDNAVPPPVGGPADATTPPGAPQPGSDPAAVTTWWDSLPCTARRQYATEYPVYVGGTDGIPDAVRDYANRATLDQLVASTTDASTLAALRALRAGLMPLPRNAEGYDPDGFPTSDVPAHTKGTFLLEVDTRTGHVILATDNPDAARHVLTWVPGVGITLDTTDVGPG